VTRLYVKICGVTSVEDALACAAAGADAIGLNFWPGSKRHITVEAAQRIAAHCPPELTRVGIFVDPTAAEVERVLASGAVEIAQFHGHEPVEFCARFRYWKAFRDIREYDESYRGELVLLDGYQRLGGGLGALRSLLKQRRALLAGGLTPENVADAVRLTQPYGVDVAGGVESAPGRKDADKVVAFIRAARQDASVPRGRQ
jgi:phosphoribosylanthranilate isomerase